MEEKYEDGLHLVIGDLDLEKLSLSATLSVAGTRFKMAPADVLERFNMKSSDRDCDEQWLSRVYLEISVGTDKVRTPLTSLRKLVDREVHRNGKQRDRIA
jgi:hypothetical protein